MEKKTFQINEIISSFVDKNFGNSFPMKKTFILRLSNHLVTNQN